MVDEGWGLACACAFVFMHVSECVHLCADILYSTLLEAVYGGVTTHCVALYMCGRGTIRYLIW